MRKTAASLVTSALLLAGFASSASAQVTQDGLVNINVGPINIEDVNVTAAANVLAGVCANVNVQAVAAIIAEVDDTGQTATLTCDLRGPRGDQTITITNN